MSEAKISCPKCAGHIVFPTELAGQAIACPHCGESIFLPKQNRKIVWLLVSALAASIAVLACVLVWQNRGKRADTTTGATARRESSSAAVARDMQPSGNEVKPASGKKSEDELVFEGLAKEYYRCITEADAKSLRSILTETCRKALTDDDLGKAFQRGASYTLLGIESVSYRQGEVGKCALAKVRRVANTGFGNQEAVRDFKFVKESGDWKVFSDFEVAEKIVAQFFDFGFTAQVKTNIQLLRAGDPFGNWDRNDTNAFEAIFKFSENQTPVFPWQIKFLVKSNRVDGRMLYLGFSVSNSSSILWDSPFLEFQLKSAGKVVLSGNELLPNVRPGQETEKDSTFFLRDALQQNAKYDLDVFCSVGRGKCQLVRDVPVEFQVVKPTDLVKFEVVKTSFDLAKTVDDSSMWAARLDYRIRNISKETINDVVVKCVWSLQNGEVLDQSSDYVLGFGDVPLSPGQVKSGFIRCGKGYGYARVPVKVDIYLETGDQRALVVKGLAIK